MPPAADLMWLGLEYYVQCFGKSETLCERGLMCSIDNIIKILCFISGLGFIHLAFFMDCPLRVIYISGFFFLSSIN